MSANLIMQYVRKKPFRLMVLILLISIVVYEFFGLAYFIHHRKIIEEFEQQLKTVLPLALNGDAKPIYELFSINMKVRYSDTDYLGTRLHTRFDGAIVSCSYDHLFWHNRIQLKIKFQDPKKRYGNNLPDGYGYVQFLILKERIYIESISYCEPKGDLYLETCVSPTR